MKNFRHGTVIDIEDPESKLDQISKDQEDSIAVCSDLDEDEKKVFRDDETFK
jgi:hypothetical protein